MPSPSPHPLLPDSARLTIEGLSVHNGAIVFSVRTIAGSAACPCCGWFSERLHSRDRRTLLDLPWQGNAVKMVLTVRKLFCDNPDCKRRVFAERLPMVAARYARKTARLADALRELAYLAGGEAAARIAQAFGLCVSPGALLYCLKRPIVAPAALTAAPTPSPTPRVLGVDDFAFRRGHAYGTILVDLEQRCPVDLLPDREPQTLIRWLQEHPGVEVISRDRGTAYIEGATKGVPQSVQVADRWHLLKNLGDALERLLTHYHKTLREVVGSAPEPAPVVRLPETSPGGSVARAESHTTIAKSSGRQRRTAGTPPGSFPGDPAPFEGWTQPA